MVDHELSPVLDWGAHTQEITQLQFSPDGRYLASRSESQIRIWDAIDGTPLATLLSDEHNDDTDFDYNRIQPHYPIVWSPVGTIIAYCEGVLQWWDTNTFNMGGIQSSNGVSTVIPPNGSCCLIQSTPRMEMGSVLSSDGGRLVTTRRDGSALISSISELENIPPFHKLSLPSVYLPLDISGSGREVLCTRTGLRGSSVEVWDTHTDRQIECLEHDSRVFTACISRCGKFVATHTVYHTTATVYLWRVSDGACLETFQHVNSRAHPVLLTPDGQTLVYGSGETVFCRPIGHLVTSDDAMYP